MVGGSTRPPKNINIYIYIYRYLKIAVKENLGATAILDVDFVVTVVFHNHKKILFSLRNVVLKILVPKISFQIDAFIICFFIAQFFRFNIFQTKRNVVKVEKKKKRF